MLLMYTQVYYSNGFGEAATTFLNAVHAMTYHLLLDGILRYNKD